MSDETWSDDMLDLLTAIFVTIKAGGTTGGLAMLWIQLFLAQLAIDEA